MRTHRSPICFVCALTLVAVVSASCMAAAAAAQTQTDLPPLVSLTPYPVEGILDVECSAAPLLQQGKQPARFRVALLGSGATGRAEALVLPAGAGRVKLSLPLAGLSPGDHAVSIRVDDQQGNVIARQTVPFVMPPTPYWLGADDGLKPDLPLGWPPVEPDVPAVKVWGREYRFDSGLFLTAATSKEASLLASPIEARLRWPGGSAVLAGPPATLAESSDARAVLRARADAGPFSADGTITVEFDGLIRTDLRLSGPPETPLEEFVLRIPLPAERARYLYHFPGQWGSVENAGALPADGWRHSFKPVVWLGDEERGLCWFAESDEHWAPYDNPEAIRITREGDLVILELNIIASPRTLAIPLDYSFGFQATPVKEVTEDVWDYRICHEGNYGIESQPYVVPAGLTYPAKGNIDLRQGTVEMWIVPMFDPDMPVPQDESRGRFNQDLFSVSLPGDAVIGFYWNIDDRGMRFYVKDGAQYPVIVGSHSSWKQGEPHHVAATWGEQVRIYVDGQLLATADHKGTLDREASAAHLALAAGPSRFILDELRISDTARSSFDLSTPPVTDSHTLLLDHFDDTFIPDGHRATAPEKSAGGGALSAGARFVPARFGKGVQLFAESDPGVTHLDRLAQLGVRTVVFHEQWTDIQNYTSTTHGEELRRLVAACHERGMKLLLYFGYEISDIAPEYLHYSGECLAYPRIGGYTRQPQQTAYVVCYASHWQDFLARGIAQVMDEYDIDGVYLDGTSNPWACANVHHGCGYRTPDGALRQTYPILATREMMKRIYNIVKARRPDGLVNVHQSTCMNIPALAFATSYWDGEQLSGIPRGADVLDLLPLDTFRTEFMGHQWGVPAELLCYGQPYTYEQAMSISLLHDVLVRGYLGGPLEAESALWRAMDEFGRRQAEWLPYWSNREFLQADPSTVKVSVYNRGPLGAVLVVSNLGPLQAAAQVSLNVEKLRLPGCSQALDLLSGDRLDWDGAALRLPLGPFSFRVVRIR